MLPGVRLTIVEPAQVLLLPLLLLFRLHIPEVIECVEAILEFFHIESALVPMVLSADGPFYFFLELFEDYLLRTLRSKVPVLVLEVLL